MSNISMPLDLIVYNTPKKIYWVKQWQWCQWLHLSIKTSPWKLKLGLLRKEV